MKTYASLILSAILLIGADFAFCSSTMKTSIPFLGKAKGGTLQICDSLNRNIQSVSISTSPDEAASDVMNKIAYNFVELDNSSMKQINDGEKGKIIEDMLQDGVLALPGYKGRYFIAGTEKGLGIPESPLFLTCKYDKNSEKIILNWENPVGGYDEILITFIWSNFEYRRREFISGQLNQFTLDLKALSIPHPLNPNDLDVWMIGFKNDIPSGIADVHVNFNVQEEYFRVPFKNGVAPNWKTWSIYQRDISDLAFYKKTNVISKNNPDQKLHFEQLLKTTSTIDTIGTYRKFLGLTSGHTYRITARLNTSNMADEDKNWSYSLHVALNDPNAKEFTPNQLAGLEALPDKSKGLSAGQAVRYDSQKVTRGEYEECSKEIVLPEGADTITVWLRFSSKFAGEVGMDYIKLEDLGKREPSL